jgi:hypothetical protein
MTVPAVAADPVTAVSENATPAPSEAPTTPVGVTEGTDAAQATSQTVPDTAVAAEGTTEDDPIKVAIRTGIEAGLATERERVREEALKSVDVDRRTAGNKQQQDSWRSAYPDAVRQAHAAAKQLKVHTPFGEEMELADTQIEAVLRPLLTHNARALDLARTEAVDRLQDEIYGALPPALQADYTASVTDKPLEEHLRAYVELTALNTKAVKGLTLDDAIKLSPKLKAELAEREALAFNKGRTKGQEDPAGEPRARSTGGSGGGYSTKAEARAAHAAGTITNADMRRINASDLPEGYS